MKYPPNVEHVVSEFHKLYYNSQAQGGTWANTFWHGVRTAKCPLDLWIYQEIIYEVQPDYIVEAGTAWGGSAYFLASICDLLKHGQVITIDIENIPGRPSHDRITYITGSSTDRRIIDQVKSLTGPGSKVMVILDSDHTKEHVLQEMNIYSELVSVGSYLIVEDGNINGHPVLPEYGPGPAEALSDFLATSDEFMIDYSRQKFYLTFNPGGYLRKTRDSTTGAVDHANKERFKYIPGFVTPNLSSAAKHLPPEEEKQLASFVSRLEAVPVTEISITLYKIALENGGLTVYLLLRNGTDNRVAVHSLPIKLKNAQGEIISKEIVKPNNLILEPISAATYMATLTTLKQHQENYSRADLSLEFTGQPQFSLA